MTIGEAYGPAMKITDQAEADAYFKILVRYSMDQGIETREEAEELNRANLGYFAGYYDNETRERVERLFKCSHPVFGKIAENGPPTPEQALLAGVKMAKRYQER
jgi:hypothetical protein